MQKMRWTLPAEIERSKVTRSELSDKPSSGTREYRSIQRIIGLTGAVAMSVMPILFAPAASAHDVVIASTPEDGSVIEEFPDEIVLEFSGMPQNSYNYVALSSADSSTVLFSGEPVLDGQYLSIEVPDDVAREPGRYTVGFRITSSDGHATPGSINFEVSGKDSDEENEATAIATSDSDDPSATVAEDFAGVPAPWNWLLSAVGIIVIGSVIAMMIAKNRNQK